MFKDDIEKLANLYISQGTARGCMHSSHTCRALDYHPFIMKLIAFILCVFFDISLSSKCRALLRNHQQEEKRSNNTKNRILCFSMNVTSTRDNKVSPLRPKGGFWRDFSGKWHDLLHMQTQTLPQRRHMQCNANITIHAMVSLISIYNAR